MNSGFCSMHPGSMALITQIPRERLSLRGWKLVVALLGALFCLASFAPTYALSSVGVSPSHVATGGTVTITISYNTAVNTGPDIFRFVTVTDPLGNAWNSTQTPFTVSETSPTMVLTFPDHGMWTQVATGSGPNAGGTDVSGQYHVTSTYIDTGLSLKTKMVFMVVKHNSFSVPEFNQSILLLVGMMVPALLLLRTRAARLPARP